MNLSTNYISRLFTSSFFHQQAFAVSNETIKKVAAAAAIAFGAMVLLYAAVKMLWSRSAKEAKDQKELPHPVKENLSKETEKPTNPVPQQPKDKGNGLTEQTEPGQPQTGLPKPALVEKKDIQDDRPPSDGSPRSQPESPKNLPVDEKDDKAASPAVSTDPGQVDDSGITTSPQPIKALHPLEIEAKNDPAKQDILNKYTLQLVEAIGGFDRFMQIPEIKDWDGTLSRGKDIPPQVTASVMRGEIKSGQRGVGYFLLFCYVKRTEESYFQQTKKRYERALDYISHSNGYWKGAKGLIDSELDLRCPNEIDAGSPGEKFLMDRISRLMKHEAVGKLKRYHGVTILKPRDHDSFRPDDSYLTGAELEEYMDTDSIFYERKPADQTSDLYLWNPAQDRKSQVKEFLGKFPDSTKSDPVDDSTEEEEEDDSGLGQSSPASSPAVQRPDDSPGDVEKKDEADEAKE